MRRISQPQVSVIIPVYNEERTIDDLLRRVLTSPYSEKEIIVIDDGSLDATPEILKGWVGQPGLMILKHGQNQGKTAAIRTGLAMANGVVTIIQDADLEYDPADFPRVIEPILRGEHDVVYGSRYMLAKQSLPWSKFRVAVCMLNGLVRVLYGQRLTDEATCYKAFKTEVLRELGVESSRFEFCAEVTAKVCRSGRNILEVPISYHPRSVDEGKKIGWSDALQTVWTLLKWRFKRLPNRKSRHYPLLLSQQASALR